MLDVPIYMGVNAPREHQRIIARLTAGLFRLFQEGKIAYEPLPEAMIDEAQTSATPDVILADAKTGQNIALIEISSQQGFKKDFRKAAEMVDDYELEEGFVYDYVSSRWRKYRRGTGEILENPSFCDAIGYDLAQFVK